jgi:hypothetical protein
MDSFDPAIFRRDNSSNIWKFVDALVGTSGAGSLINQVFLSNLSAALDTCYFNELDYIVGNIRFMARTTAEAYTYNPLADQLTSDQWDEVKIKDAWFRARIKEFFAACQLGGTPEGIKKVVSAAVGVDCTIQEVWRYVDNFLDVLDLTTRSNFPTTGQAGKIYVAANTGKVYKWDGSAYVDSMTLGRTESGKKLHYAVTNLKTGFEVMFSGTNTAGSPESRAIAFRNSKSPNEANWEVREIRPRNEVVIRPHKTSLHPTENRLLRELLNRILPLETVVTVDINGLSASVPVNISAAAADDSYYEVIKQVIPSPLVGQMPDPEYLPIDLLPGEQWLLKKPVVRGPFSELLEFLSKNEDKREAPYAAFMQTCQHSYYYLIGDGKHSPIDSVTYGTLQSDGSVKSEQNYVVYQDNSSYTGWMNYEKADSPDNYPGGKFGQHPGYAPAVNPDGTPYSYPYVSQSAFVVEMIEKVKAMGGVANNNQYRLPIQKNQTIVYTYYPEYAVANFPPTKESTVSASITRRRPRTSGNNLGDTSNFVR